MNAPLMGIQDTIQIVDHLELCVAARTFFCWCQLGDHAWLWCACACVVCVPAGAGHPTAAPLRDGAGREQSGAASPSARKVSGTEWSQNTGNQRSACGLQLVASCMATIQQVCLSVCMRVRVCSSGYGFCNPAPSKSRSSKPKKNNKKKAKAAQ